MTFYRFGGGTGAQGNRLLARSLLRLRGYRNEPLDGVCYVNWLVPGSLIFCNNSNGQQYTEILLAYTRTSLSCREQQ